MFVKMVHEYHSSLCLWVVSNKKIILKLEILGVAKFLRLWFNDKVLSNNTSNLSNLLSYAFIQHLTLLTLPFSSMQAQPTQAKNLLLPQCCQPPNV